MKKLAIITTHPIQYYAPIFKLLHERANISIMVFYTWGEGSKTKHDPGFEKTIHWDIPLLDGYPFAWAKNVSGRPGTHRFNGIITPYLCSQVDNWHADAILVFGWAWQSHLKVIRHFKGKIPVLFRGDSTLLSNQFSWKTLFKSIFLPWVYRHVDVALYVGSNNKAYFKKYGLAEDQLVFAPHAVDNIRFAADNSNEATRLRSVLGIDAAAELVLYAGKFEEVKNIPLLVSAFIQLNKPNVHLLLLGNGRLEQELKSIAKGHNNIHFMDFQNQSVMPSIYQACDLFCLPSTSETWGMGINEAMACGKAVLTSDRVGAAIDLIINQVNGAIFESGNIKDLQEKLDFLTGSIDRLIEMGNHSLSIINNWNLNETVKAIEYALNKLDDNPNRIKL